MIKSFIMLGLLCAVTSCFYAQEGTWDVYIANYEKGAGTTLLDMSLKSVAPVKDYPFLLITGVKTTECGTDGFPTKNEFEHLYSISDKIAEVIGLRTKYKLTGAFTYQCNRTDFYYLSDTTGIRSLLDSVYKNSFSKYGYEIKIKNDPAWDAYLTFLYPNEETQEYMANQRIVLTLQQSGDNLTEARKVDHWLYFSTSGDRDHFAAYALDKEYSIEEKDFKRGAQLPYMLHISRVDRVDLNSITDITIELRKMAAQFNGAYDGWETYVIK